MLGEDHWNNGTFNWKEVSLLIFSLDDSFRFLARSTFRRMGAAEVFSTSVAADAPSLLAHFPDIVLVDLEGEAEQAIAFLKRVRSGKDNPRVAVPALAVIKDLDGLHVPRLLDIGIEGIINKPVVAAGLAKKVTDTLDNPRRMPPAPREERPHIVLDRTPAPRGAADSGRTAIAASRPHGGSPPGHPSTAVAARPVAHDASIGVGAGGGIETARPAAFSSGGGIEVAAAPAKPKPEHGIEVAAAAPAKAKAEHGIEVAADAPAKPKPVAGLEVAAPAKSEAAIAAKAAADEAIKTKKRRKAAADWQMGLAEAGHKARNGKDVAGLDLGPIVADHAKWVATQGAEGHRANFDGKDLAGADLAGTALAGAGFRRADLSDACMAEARLDGADLRYATMSAADCSAAVLGVAQLRHADLRLANLEGANLRGADLSGARLGGARLDGADFNGAILVETDLRAADLSRVENLRQAQLSRALGDRTTRLPLGLRLRSREEA